LLGTKIGFIAISKSYAADMAKKLLVERGVCSGIINASGDMALRANSLMASNGK
jgi:thiamine biosynthesis lipoprotein